jgi:hypothetical protein
MSVLLSADMLTHHHSVLTVALHECRLLAFPKVLFPFPCSFFLGLSHVRPFQEALTYARSKMRAARSDLGCAAPKSAMSSRHHGEARCDRRIRLGARCRLENSPVTHCSLARRRRRWVLTMAADREESRGPRRFKSQPRYYPMGRAPEPARRFSCLTPCQGAMTIALFRSRRGPSAALFTVRRM